MSSVLVLRIRIRNASLRMRRGIREGQHLVRTYHTSILGIYISHSEKLLTISVCDSLLVLAALAVPAAFWLSQKGTTSKS